MTINGLQKLTLLDYPQHTACTIFTAGCNFRCPFCHNAGLVTKLDQSETIQTDEVLSFLKKRVGLLDGVCITGGEPLLQEDIEDFISEVKALGYKIKLDTNGSQPERLKALIENGLVDYIAMDIKNSKLRYSETCGVSISLEDIEKSVEIIKGSGVDYEFRTTIVKGLHESEDISELARWIAPCKRYFLQNFVDSGNLIGKGLIAHDPEVLQEMKARATELIPSTEIRGI